MQYDKGSALPEEEQSPVLKMRCASGYFTCSMPRMMMEWPGKEHM